MFGVVRPGLPVDACLGLSTWEEQQWAVSHANNGWEHHQNMFVGQPVHVMPRSGSGMFAVSSSLLHHGTPPLGSLAHWGHHQVPTSLPGTVTALFFLSVQVQEGCLLNGCHTSGSTGQGFRLFTPAHCPHLITRGCLTFVLSTWLCLPGEVLNLNACNGFCHNKVSVSGKLGVPLIRFIFISVAREG